MKNTWIKFAAAAAAAAILAGAGVTARLYSQKKATEAADAAQRAKWEGSAASQENAAGQDQSAAAGRKEIDYGYFATNEYSESNVRNRAQLFKFKTILYNGKHYARHTGIKAILLLGLDRHGDDLKEERVPWEQGQTDAIYLLAYNTARNSVKILKIPRDTMALMEWTNNEGVVIGDRIQQLTLAFTAGDGVYDSCQKTCDAVSRVLGGLPIDHYMLGDLNVIGDVNDLVGGVTVKIPEDDANWEDPAFVKGKTITLQGKQAETFVRRRDVTKDNTALGRIERQEIYMIAFEKQLKKCLKSDGKFVDRMFDTIEGDMLTDMKRGEYVDLTLSLLSGSDLSGKDFLLLPGETNNDKYYDEYRPHYADIDEMILDIFYYEST